MAPVDAARASQYNRSTMKRSAVFRPVLVAVLTLAVVLPDHVSAAVRADKVLVIKSVKRLVLLNHGAVLKSYKVALGRNPGRKTRRGDGRTPEGRYIVDGRIPESRFHKALHLSYPNASDVVHSRASGIPPGGNIVIHGLPADFEDVGPLHASRNWTMGCIAVSNEEMDEIWQLVPLGTAVEIIP